MDTIKLLKQIIPIPSYYSSSSNESRYGEFISEFIKYNTSLNLIRQTVDEMRTNIIAHDGYPIKLLFACHLDTTPPHYGNYNPLKPIIKSNRLYGLGAKDMKGGTACLLSALANISNSRGLAVLFYVDEERELLGMHQFIKHPLLPEPTKPQLIISPESQFIINHGNRGITSVEVKVQGLSAHSARPQKGINAITVAVKAFNNLKNKVETMNNVELGSSVANLAYLFGGSTPTNPKELIPNRKMNSVPDIAEMGVSVRTSLPKLNSVFVINELRKETEDNHGKLIDVKIIHDYTPVYVDRRHLGPLVKSITSCGFTPKFRSDGNSGYNDVALAATHFGAPYANFGPRGSGNHGPDEYVLISDLEPTTRIFTELIHRLCT